MAPSAPPPSRKERAAARLALCLACPFLMRRDRKPAEKCSACGCLVRAKVQLGGSCPKGKW